MDKILAFCHVVKAGGTTVESVLRKAYGIRHLDVYPKTDAGEYKLAEMSRDLKFMPWVKSMSGHGLRPYINYGEFEQRLVWVIWLREPISRLISGYQHSCMRNGYSQSFDKFILDARRKNRQVYFLSGSPDDLVGAKKMLIEKVKVVGLLERFDESLSLLKYVVPNRALSLAYVKPKNVASSSEIARQIYENIDDYSGLLNEVAGLDIELYDWVKGSIYDAQLEALKKNQSCSSGENLAAIGKNMSSLNIPLNRLIYRGFYRPFLSRI